jgi:hypothetical protein
MFLNVFFITGLIYLLRVYVRTINGFYNLIPTDADAHALAQSRRPMDMISQGRSVSLVQASQQ